MSDRSHTAAQRDFSAGEVDPELKRSEDHPIFKASLRQCQNFRITNTKKLKNRIGRTALLIDGPRVEEVLMAPGVIFKLVFGPGYLRVYNAAGTQVFNSGLLGDGVTPIPWTANTAKNITWDVFQSSIYIFYADNAPSNVPQVLTWNGGSSFTLTTFAELVTGGNQKRTFFARISPQGVTMLPSAQTGSITLTFSSAIAVAGQVGTRMRFVGRQVLITGFVSNTVLNATVQETLLGSQVLTYGVNPSSTYNVGDVVIGSVTGSKGVVTAVSPTTITVQLLTSNATLLQNPTASSPSVGQIIAGVLYSPSINTGTPVTAFTTSDVVAGPSGALTPSAVGAIGNPTAVAIWDEEVMNTGFRGWPSSVVVDQGRLALMNFPSIPAGIGYSAFGTPTDLYVPFSNVVPANAIFEIAPNKSQVLYMVPGHESSEFIFCDNAVYYFPITLQQPLSGTIGVAFNKMTAEGSANVQPRMVQEAIVYVSAGGSTLRAITATGAYLRPYEVRAISELHDHLLSSPIAIAAPSATDPNFPERYIYVLNGNGTLAVAKIKIQDGRLLEEPGWVSMSGAGSVTWVSARAADVIFTTTYQTGTALPVTIAEINDATQFLDAALPYNNVPAALAPVPGKGPLWWLANGTVTVMDLGTRQLGTYNVDVNGFLVPQFQGGENLTSSQLIVGQAWTATLEPWMAGPEPGADFDQRFTERAVERIGVYYQNSTGFVFQKLFSKKQGPKQPALGTVVRTERVPTYNQDDDPTQPPILREGFDYWRPIGREYDPRIAIVKDTAGPLTILEIGSEVTV